MKKKLFLVMMLIGTALFITQVESALADVVTTHGAVVHLDPFVGGPVAAGVVGPGACGTPGEIVLAGALGVTWNSVTCPTPGVDVLPSPLGWHWEMEIDILGLVGIVPTSIFGGPFLPVAYGPGTDLLLDVHQIDLADSFTAPGVLFGVGGLYCMPGPAEVSTVGDVCKQLLNLTPFPVAWGTSVSEDPNQIVGVFDGPHNTLFISSSTSGITIDKASPVPEPSTILLLGSGLAGLVYWRRRQVSK